MRPPPPPGAGLVVGVVSAGARPVSWTSRMMREASTPRVGHGFGGFAVHAGGLLRHHGGRGVVEAPLHTGEHAVLVPLVGARGVGADPARGDRHGGDDHAAAEIEHEVLADVAAGDAHPGLGGVGAGDGLRGGRAGQASDRRGGVGDGGVLVVGRRGGARRCGKNAEPGVGLGRLGWLTGVRVAAHGQQSTADKQGGHHGGGREPDRDVLVVAGPPLRFREAICGIVGSAGGSELVDEIGTWQRAFGAVGLPAGTGIT